MGYWKQDCVVCGQTFTSDRPESVCPGCINPVVLSRVKDPRVEKLEKENELLREENEILKTDFTASLMTSVLHDREQRCKRIEEELERLREHLLKEALMCGTCGGRIVAIRGRHPREPNRKICPTCVVEQLEHMVAAFNMRETRCDIDFEDDDER